MHSPIVLVERGRTLQFTFEDVLTYHGPGSPGGAAIGFVALGCALSLICPEGGCERRDVEIETAFRGPGARDAFELVTRAVTAERFRIDAGLERPERGVALERFVFRIGYRGRWITLLLRDGFVTGEFIALARTEGRDAAQEERLDALKLDLAARVLAVPAAEAFEVE